MSDQQTTTPPPPSLWAIVELFGHQRIAGRISEQTFGGASMVRVDVPDVTAKTHRFEAGERVEVKRLIPAHTRSFGPGAIYSVNWCDEAAARVAAHSIEHEPLSAFSLRNAFDAMSEPERTRLLGRMPEDDDTDGHLLD